MNKNHDNDDMWQIGDDDNDDDDDYEDDDNGRQQQCNMGQNRKNTE